MQGAPWLSDQVSEVGYRSRPLTDQGFAYVGCLRKFGSTPVVVELHHAQPPEPDQRRQHVAEVSLLTDDDKFLVVSEVARGRDLLR